MEENNGNVKLNIQNDIIIDTKEGTFFIKYLSMNHANSNTFQKALSEKIMKPILKGKKTTFVTYYNKCANMHVRFDSEKVTRKISTLTLKIRINNPNSNIRKLKSN